MVGGSASANGAPSVDVDREVEQLAEEGRFSEAAERLREALGELPESFNNRDRRNLLASQAVNAYALAFERAPNECQLAVSGIEVASKYLSALLAVYGGDARQSDEYVGIDASRRELEEARRQRGCPDGTTPPATKVPPLPPTPTAEEPPPRDEEPAPSDEGEEAGRRRLVAGLAASASLTGVLLAVSLGTGLSRFKEPFQGAAYARIYEAARGSFDDGVAGNEVDYGAMSDMCSDSARMINGDVDDACRAWDRLGITAIATGVGAGVMGATTVTLAVLLKRRALRDSKVMARARSHQMSMGAAPSRRRGAMFTFRVRF